MTLTGNQTSEDRKLNAAIGIASSLYLLSVPKGFGEKSQEAKNEDVARLAGEFRETLRALGFEIVAVAEGGSN